jgi:ferrous iron transport protein B
MGAYSEDEIIARDYILLEKPDSVINVIDATNLERNLYMTIQMLEMGAKVVLSLNMYDEVRNKKIQLDVQELAKRLNLPVIPTVATRKEGMKDLINSTLANSKQGFKEPLYINYGKAAETEIDRLKENIQSIPHLTDQFNTRWLAIKVLEGDENILKIISRFGDISTLLSQRESAVKRLEDATGEDTASIFAGGRYAYISEILKKTLVKRPEAAGKRPFPIKSTEWSLTASGVSPFFWWPCTPFFNLLLRSAIPDRLGRDVFEWFGGIIGTGLAAISAPAFLTSLLVDGVIGGVGSVLFFCPIFCCCSWQFPSWKTAVIWPERPILWTDSCIPWPAWQGVHPHDTGFRL